jgi:hypothetical protein
MQAASTPELKAKIQGLNARTQALKIQACIQAASTPEFKAKMQGLSA